MVHSNNLGSSYSNNAVLERDVDDNVDDDNSTDHMDMVMDMMDNGDLDRLVAELLIAFSSLALDDTQTMDEIHECVVVALLLLCFVWAKLCLA